MGHVSRQYLREKWNSAKRDMEDFLQVNNEELPDGIFSNDVNACIGNIEHQFAVIISELKKYKD